MGLLDRFLLRRERWSLEGRQPPWGDREAICSHIEEHVDDSGRLDEVGHRLPDEQRVERPGGVRWAPGAIDGVISHHAGGCDDEHDDLLERVVESVLEVLDEVDDARLTRLYQLLCELNALEIVDPLLEQLGEALPDDDRVLERLAVLAEWLVRRAPDREPVKLAIALLGRFRGARHQDLFVTLGAHEELTLYAAVALASSLDDPSQSLWALARRVHGWGRIHAVERLVHTRDPEILDWLLRQGYDNDVMIEYLAYTCAVAGGLLNALDVEQLDDQLLDAAGELVEALIAGGPAENIDDYDDGAQVAERYLHHLSRAPAPALAHLVTAGTVLGFLAVDREDEGEARAARGWTPERVQRIAELAESIIARPSWKAEVTASLEQLDDAERFCLASRAAALLGVDPWPHHFRRLRHCEPEDGWFHVMETEDRQRVEQVVEEARARLPIADIASGPAEELGLGPEHRHHRALDHILSGLLPHPGLGWDLVAGALASPVVRNRHGALRVLDAWPRSRWPEAAPQALAEACRREICADLQTEMQRLVTDSEEQPQPGG